MIEARSVDAAAPGSDSSRDRDPYWDLLRTGALAIVVIWHWVFSTVAITDNGIGVDNVISVLDWGWVLTWAVQPMCVFFAVGGALHSTDQRRARDFYRGRLQRLVTPTIGLLTTAAVAWGAATAVGAGTVAEGVILAISPLWFLAVYLTCVAVAPAARRLNNRYGLVAAIVAAAVAVVVDQLRRSGHTPSGIGAVTMFITTWAAVHQLGMVWPALRRNRRTATAVAAVGFAGLAIGATIGGYPAAMVGSSRDTISNMGPPNTMVVALAWAQIGLLAAASGPISDYAQRHRLTLERISAHSMNVYLWHLVAYCVFIAALAATGTTAGNDTINAAWWMSRPMWFAGPAVIYLTAAAAAASLRTRARSHAR